MFDLPADPIDAIWLSQRYGALALGKLLVMSQVGWGVALPR